MENYDEIALQAIKNACLVDEPEKFVNFDNNMNIIIYEVAYEAARLQAERFNKDLDDSYIESLSKEELN